MIQFGVSREGEGKLLCDTDSAHSLSDTTTHHIAHSLNFKTYTGNTEEGGEWTGISTANSHHTCQAVKPAFMVRPEQIYST